MWCCNPRWVFPIYTCIRHKNSNTRTVTKTATHLGFAASTAAPPRLLHPVHRRASTIRREGLWNRHSQRSCTGRGWIRFLESDHRDYSLASSCSSPWLVYLFIVRAPRVIAFNVNFVRPIAVFIQWSSSRNRKSCTVPTLKSCLTYLICWSMYAWFC
jgi:hypothetical protein